jgi:hypothetical protein
MYAFVSDNVSRLAQLECLRIPQQVPVVGGDVYIVGAGNAGSAGAFGPFSDEDLIPWLRRINSDLEAKMIEFHTQFFALMAIPLRLESSEPADMCPRVLYVSSLPPTGSASVFQRLAPLLTASASPRGVLFIAESTDGATSETSFRWASALLVSSAETMSKDAFLAAVSSCRLCVKLWRTIRQK